VSAGVKTISNAILVEIILAYLTGAIPRIIYAQSALREWKSASNAEGIVLVKTWSNPCGEGYAMSVTPVRIGNTEKCM